jgi:hypothetical protein
MDPNKQSLSSRIGSDVYTGVATFGRVQAVMGAVIGVIIALVLILIGAAKLRDPHTAAAAMTVTSSACDAQTDPTDGSKSWLCTVDLQFTYQGRIYNARQVRVVSASPLNAGATITARFNPRDPAGGVVQEPSPRALGWGLIGGGLAVGAIGVTMAVLAFKSKGFAAVEGSVGILSAFRR